MERPEGLATLCLDGDIDHAGMEFFIKKYRDEFWNAKDLLIVCNSLGGSRHIMQKCAEKILCAALERKKRVVFVVDERAYSAASHLVLSGHACFMMPGARFGVHAGHIPHIKVSHGVRPLFDEMLQYADMKLLSDMSDDVFDRRVALSLEGLAEWQLENYSKQTTALSIETWQQWLATEKMTCLTPEKAAFFGLITAATPPVWVVEEVDKVREARGLPPRGAQGELPFIFGR